MLLFKKKRERFVGLDQQSLMGVVKDDVESPDEVVAQNTFAGLLFGANFDRSKGGSNIRQFITANLQSFAATLVAIDVAAKTGAETFPGHVLRKSESLLRVDEQFERITGCEVDVDFKRYDFTVDDFDSDVEKR